jgi:hypothetical protein
MPEITRRAVMSKAPAAIAALAVHPVLTAAGNPDAELLRLGSEFDALEAQSQEAEAEGQSLEEKKFAILDETRPEALRGAPDDERLLGLKPDWWTRGKIEELYATTLDEDGQDRRAEIWDAYADHYITGAPARAAEEAAGLTAAARAHAAITDAMQPYVDAILAMPARTVQGIAVKVRVALAFKDDDVIPDDLSEHTGNLDTDALLSVLRAGLQLAEENVS